MGNVVRVLAEGVGFPFVLMLALTWQPNREKRRVRDWGVGKLQEESRCHVLGRGASASPVHKVYLTSSLLNCSRDLLESDAVQGRHCDLSEDFSCPGNWCLGLQLWEVGAEHVMKC